MLNRGAQANFNSTFFLLLYLVSWIPEIRQYRDSFGGVFSSRGPFSSDGEKNRPVITTAGPQLNQDARSFIEKIQEKRSCRNRNYSKSRGTGVLVRKKLSNKTTREREREREREERVEIPLGWQERSSNERRIPVARAQRHRLKGKGFPRAALSRIKRTPPSFLLFFPLRRATVKPSFFPKKRHQTPRGSLLCATELFFAKNGATVPRFLIPSFVPSLQSLLGPLSRESRDN